MPFFVLEKNHYIFNKKQAALLKLKIIKKYNKKKIPMHLALSEAIRMTI